MFVYVINMLLYALFTFVVIVYLLYCFIFFYFMVLILLFYYGDILMLCMCECVLLRLSVRCGMFIYVINMLLYAIFTFVVIV